MSEIHISQDYPYAPETVWRAVTDPALVPLWTSTGRGGTPEGFAPEVGCQFRFVGKPVPGWDGIVRCEVLEVDPPSLLRYSWRDDKDTVTQVTYRLEAHEGGTRFSYDHTGFTGAGGLMMSALILGPVRRRMLSKGLPAVLETLGTR
ncbi:MAG TPA: SRPBCC domain-containing protein [Streptosporangiaceae bacterium]|nr:SRPBCC domain-containing protein [Streptosporangiaceae bacterium]